MKQRTFKVLSIALSAVPIFGCNVGMAPSGMSNDDAKAAIAAMTPEQKIRAIASSPMPGPEKQKQFDQIERETGVKASDVLGGNMGSPGAGQPK